MVSVVQKVALAYLARKGGTARFISATAGISANEGSCFGCHSGEDCRNIPPIDLKIQKARRSRSKYLAKFNGKHTHI